MRKLVMVLVAMLGATMFSQEALNKSTLESQLLKRVKELYKENAPTKITIVSVPATSSQLGAMTAEDTQKRGEHASTADASTSNAESSATEASAKKGDIATGVIIQELSGSLYVDVSPCHAKLLTFIKPYKKTQIGSVACGHQTFPRYAIEQLR